jgi:hypothetical protein
MATKRGIFGLKQLANREDGCDLHDVCTTCPLPACRYDLQPKESRAYFRATELKRLLDSRIGITAAAERMGMRERSALRLYENYVLKGKVLNVPVL